jgi:nicotinamidase-related amidase
MRDKVDALLVIDVQRGMFADPAMQPHEGEAVVRRIAGLIDRARENGVTVIFVQHKGEAGDLLAGDAPGFALHPAIVPRADEAVIVKRFCSAFQDTSLQAKLVAEGIKRVAVCGLQTEFCVDTTCRAAFERGLTVTLVEDGHTTFGNQVLSGGDIIRHHNATLGAGFVTVTEANGL